MLKKMMAAVALVGVITLAGCAGGNAMDAYMGKWVTEDVAVSENVDGTTAEMMKSLLSDMTFDINSDGTLTVVTAGEQASGTWEPGKDGSCLWHYPNAKGVEQTMEAHVDGNVIHISMPMGGNGQTCNITMKKASE